jgi:hypothetical protein
MIEMQDFEEEVEKLEKHLMNQIRLVRALANFNTTNGLNGGSWQEELANQRIQILRTIKRIEKDFETLSAKWRQVEPRQEGAQPEAAPPQMAQEVESDTAIITRFIRLAVPEEARNVWRPGDFTGSLLVFFVDGEIDSSSLLEKKIIHTKPDVEEPEEVKNDRSGQVKVVVEPEETFSILKTPHTSKVSIYFTLPEAAVVLIKVYNRMDQVVRQFEEEYDTPGDYSVEWDGIDDEGNVLPKDTYFCQLQIGSSLSELKTIVLS